MAFGRYCLLVIPFVAISDGLRVRGSVLKGMPSVAGREIYDYGSVGQRITLQTLIVSLSFGSPPMAMFPHFESPCLIKDTP